MARRTEMALTRLLKESRWILGATLVKRYLRCRRRDCAVCREQGGHGPAYYLSRRRADGRTQMVYVPKGSLGEARAGVAAWKRVKEALRRLGAEEVARWRREKKR